MTSSDGESTEVRRKRLSHAAQVEGSLSLPIVLLTFCNPLLPALPETHALPIWLALWACGWLFGISGIRHGKRAARVMAALALAILILEAVWSLTPLLHGAGSLAAL